MEQNSSKCPKCGQENNNSFYYCCQCGSFIRVKGATVPKFNRHFRPSSVNQTIVESKIRATEPANPSFVSDFNPATILESTSSADFFDPFDVAIPESSPISSNSSLPSLFDPIGGDLQVSPIQQTTSISDAPKGESENVATTSNKYIICNVCNQKIEYHDTRPKRCPKCQNNELHRCPEFDASISDDLFVSDSPALPVEQCNPVEPSHSIGSSSNENAVSFSEQSEQPRRRIKHIDVDNSILKLICMQDNTIFDIPQNGCVIGSAGTLNADWFAAHDGIQPMHIQIMHYPSGWYMKAICDAPTRYNGNVIDRDAEIKLENNAFITVGSLSFTLMAVKL